MTYIPDIRDKYNTPICKNTKGASKEPEENGYWQGFLDDDDVVYMKGFDDATDIACDNVYENLEIFEDDLMEAIDPEYYNKEDGPEFEDLIDLDVVGGNKCLDEYSDEEKEKMTPYTRLLLTLRKCVSQYVESERNELGVSMIESIPDNRYEAIKKAVKEGKRKNIFTQEEKSEE